MKTAGLKKFLHHNLEIILLSLIPSTLYFKENVNAYFLLAFLFYWLYQRKYRNIDQSLLKGLRLYLLFAVLYITGICVGNLFTSDIASATNFLFKQLTLLAFPVVLSHIQWTEKNKQIFNGIFVGATVVFLTYLWFQVILRIVDTGSLYMVDPLHPTWKYYHFTSGRLSPEVHPTFLSLYLTYCLFYLGSQVGKTGTFLRKAVLYMVMLLFLINLLLLSSRGALLSLLLVFVGHELIKAVLDKSKASLARLFLTGLVVVLIFSGTSVFKRISKISNYFDRPLVEIANIDNSSGNRAQIYLIAGKIIEDNFWLGIGSKNWGTSSKEYYNRYFREDFDYNIDSLNTHNQFLNSWVSWGFFGLIFLGGVVLCPIYISYRAGNAEDCKFLFFFLFVLLTENILDRHRGIIFFSLISSYIMIHAFGRSSDG